VTPPPEHLPHSRMAGFGFHGSRLQPPTAPATLVGYAGFWWGPNVGPPGFTSKVWTTQLVGSSALGCCRPPIILGTVSANEVLLGSRGPSSGPEGSIAVVTPLIWERGSLGAVSAWLGW
jgi:hypothetical protein